MIGEQEREIKSFDLAKWQNFNEPQKRAAKEFWKKKYVGVGGAMGGGKSYWIRCMAVEAALHYYATYGIKGIQVGIFCENYPALQGRQISKVKEHFPNWLGTWIETRKTFELYPEYGSGNIRFLNLDDPSKYDSEEIPVQFIDEGQKDKRSDFDTLRRRLRWSGVGDDVHMAVSFNPPKQNEDPWVRELFIDGAFHPNEQEKDKFGFVPFPPKDNAKNLPSDYFAQFSGMSEADRSAYLDGDMHAFDAVMSDEGYRPLLTSAEIADRIIPRAGAILPPCILGIDPGGGGDPTAMVIKDEMQYEVVFSQKTKDTLIAIQPALEIIRENNVSHVVVDKTGLGWAFYLRLKEVVAQSEDLRHVKVHGIGFGEKSRKPERYKNLKAELFMLLRQSILEKGCRLVFDDAKPWNALSAIRFKANSDGKWIEIEKKEDLLARGIASPNECDSAALCNFPVIAQRDPLTLPNPLSSTWRKIWKQ